MIDIFLANGFEEIEAIAVIDVLRRAELDVRTVSISDNIRVVGAHNVAIEADALISDIDSSNSEMLILPGGMPGTTNLGACEKLISVLRNQYSRKGWIAAICAAPSILGREEILIGERATCYPGFEKELIGAELSEERVVVSNRIITSRGPGSAIEFGLKIVEMLKGAESAKMLKEGMIVK